MSKKRVNLNVLIRSILILIVLIAIFILVIYVPESGEFNPDVNKSRYRTEKNADELKAVYEKQGNKEKFLDDVSKIQNAVSMALLNNNVVDEKTMNSRIDDINKEMKKDKWDLLGIEVPVFWVGTWSVDNVGTVKFTFLNKASIPSWAADEDAAPHVIID